MKIKELFERHQSVSTAGFSSGAYKPGLEAMRRLDATLGNPSGAFRSIHVAGTNGKGSVCSMIASSLAAAGFKTGLYTSPHLVDFRERMKICTPGGFTMIPPQDVEEFLDRHEQDIEGMTFFEVTTGMAFWWFAKERVDYALIEVGLGGRLDSTNIITPEVSVITSIGLDHCALLGGTRAEIASEKAGIFKPGVTAVVWGHDSETDPVFVRKASLEGCPLVFADSLRIKGSLPSLDLEAPCQGSNLRTVLSVLDILGVEPDKDAIAHAAALTGLQGRWEKKAIRTSDGKAVNLILDIGHNPAALKSNFSRLPEGAAIVYGVMADKDYKTNISLLPLSSGVFLCEPGTPRALPLAELAAAVAALSPSLRAEASGSVASAIERAIASTPDGGTIYIGGSTFVVSEAELFCERITQDRTL